MINSIDYTNLKLTGRDYYYKNKIYGQNVVIAVFDTGYIPHNELEDRVFEGKTFDKNGIQDGCYNPNASHGNHCIGIVAGKNCGVAPKAKILPIRILGSTGLMKAIDYCINWRGKNGEKVNIISASLTFLKANLPDSYIESMRNSIKKAIENDIVFICASGNYGKDKELRYPACFNEPIVVASCDRKKKISDSSSVRDTVDFTQIGVSIWSCAHDNPNKLVVKSGTSMATPTIAGICALIISAYYQKYKKYPKENYVFKKLIENTQDLGVKGKDPYYGYGFVSLKKYNI